MYIVHIAFRKCVRRVRLLCFVAALKRIAKLNELCTRNGMASQRKILKAKQKAANDSIVQFKIENHKQHRSKQQMEIFLLVIYLVRIVVVVLFLFLTINIFVFVSMFAFSGPCVVSRVLRM